MRHCQPSEASYLSLLDHNLSPLLKTRPVFCDNGFLDFPFSFSFKSYRIVLSAFELYIDGVYCIFFLLLIAFTQHYVCSCSLSIGLILFNTNPYCLYSLRYIWICWLFPVGAIMNSPAINNLICIFWYICIGISLGSTIRNRIAEF